MIINNIEKFLYYSEPEPPSSMVQLHDITDRPKGRVRHFFPFFIVLFLVPVYMH